MTVADLVLDEGTGEVTQPAGSASTDVGQCNCAAKTTYANGMTYSVCFANQFYKDDCDWRASTMEWIDQTGNGLIYSELDPDYPNPIFDSGSTLTDEEISDAITPNMSESLMKDVLTDIPSGLPNSNTSETPLPQDTATADTDPFTAEADSLSSEYDTSIQNDPNTNPVSTTTNNSYTNNETVPVIEVEIPNHCEENPDTIGCSVYGDISGVTIPTETPSFSYSPVILSGSATCPDPSTATTTFGTLEMSNQPLCDFASGISPVVITLCSFLSIYLLVGGVRNG